MSIFVDENNHLRWSKYPSLVFDGHDPDRRAEVILHSNNIDYGHQQFFISKEGTICHFSRTDIVIGTDESKTKVQWVK